MVPGLLSGINNLQKHQAALQLPPGDCLCETIDAIRTNAFLVAGLESFTFLMIGCGKSFVFLICRLFGGWYITRMLINLIK